MKTKLLIVTLLITISSYSQELKYASVDIISGGIISSIQSCFHSNPTAKSISKAFYKGCIGGSIQHCSKLIIKKSAENNNFNLIWPARICNSIGTSIIINSSNNKPIFDEIYTQFYFTYLNYNIKNKKFGIKLDAISTGYTLYSLFNNSFDFKNSLKIGSLTFNGFDSNKQRTGRTVGNHIFLSKENSIIKINGIYKKLNINNTILHEIIHTIQYEQYHSINNHLNIKFIDFNMNFSVLYILNSISGYNKNYFEKEANYFSY